MRPMRSRLLAAVPALLLLATLSACGEDDSRASDNTSPTPSPSATVTVDDGQNAGTPATSGTCDYKEDGTVKDVQLPPAPTVDGPVRATIKTSAGDLAVTLDGKKAPCTVNSFLFLAAKGYFDDTPCHRLTSYDTLSVLQCGDPTGQGTGGPGYTIPDELDPAATYSAGTLAMANTGDPHSGGSQFFIVYADSQLKPDYTVFGSIDKAGIDLVTKLAKAGSTPTGDGAPNTPVSIGNVAIVK